MTMTVCPDGFLAVRRVRARDIGPSHIMPDHCSVLDPRSVTRVFSDRARSSDFTRLQSRRAAAAPGNRAGEWSPHSRMSAMARTPVREEFLPVDLSELRLRSIALRDRTATRMDHRCTKRQAEFTIYENRTIYRPCRLNDQTGSTIDTARFPFSLITL
jgi:hypothetical protein